MKTKLTIKTLLVLVVAIFMTVDMTYAQSQKSRGGQTTTAPTTQPSQTVAPTTAPSTSATQKSRGGKVDDTAKVAGSTSTEPSQKSRGGQINAPAPTPTAKTYPVPATVITKPAPAPIVQPAPTVPAPVRVVTQPTVAPTTTDWKPVQAAPAAVTTTSGSGLGNAFGDFPSAVGAPGKCYAKCRIPECVVMSEKTIKIKEAGVKYELIPAEYSTVTEQVLKEEASTKLRVIPAEYETVREEVLVKEASTKLREVPARYKTVTEQKLVSEGYGQWIRKKRYAGCTSVNPEDCYIMCWEETPAKYETITKKVVETPSRTETIEVPAEYRTITKRMLKNPARVEETVVPARYQSITKTVVSRPAEAREIAVPAEYKSVPVKIIADAGKYTAWQEVMCESSRTASNISEVQKALLAKGYNAGATDGVLGSKTGLALEQYQKDNSLPIGNLNLKTLDALGVKY